MDFKVTEVSGLRIFYREAGEPSNPPSFFCMAFRRRHTTSTT